LKRLRTSFADAISCSSDGRGMCMIFEFMKNSIYKVGNSETDYCYLIKEHHPLFILFLEHVGAKIQLLQYWMLDSTQAY
jgi:hypothetical protein